MRHESVYDASAHSSEIFVVEVLMESSPQPLACTLDTAAPLYASFLITSAVKKSFLLIDFSSMLLSFLFHMIIFFCSNQFMKI